MQPHVRPRARLLWALVSGAVTLGLFAGCEEGTLVNLRPKLVADPEPGTTIDFGTAVLTRSGVEPRRIELRNEGDGALTLEQPVFEGPGADAFVVISYPRVLAPGAIGELLLRYDPPAPIAAEVTLKLASNDPVNREVTWPLRGVAKEPCLLYADQARIYFNAGDVKPLKLISLTTNDCAIDRISLDRRVFPIMNEPELPMIVPGGGSVTLEIQHQAGSARQPGTPVREMTFYEHEGSTLTVVLEGEPPLFGCLSAAPLEILFPQTEIGQTRQQRVTVANRCGKPAELVSTVVSRGWDTFDVGSPREYPVTVPPQGTVDVLITYSPVGGREVDSGMVVINTNDAANIQFKVSINGSAAVPQITHFPTRLDFGNVIHRTLSGSERSDCSSALRTVQIHNIGSGPLEINRLEIDGAGDGFFDITGVVVGNTPIPNFNNPFTIPRGDLGNADSAKAEITLQFYPSRAMPAEHTGKLLIHHNAGPDAAEVELLGHASEDGPASDSFDQLLGPKADILWVVDNSCSMYDEQARLISNLSRFVSYADQLESDYQMAVVVTDSRSSRAGTFEQCYPHPRIVRNDYARREEAFRCLFEVGTNGSGTEAGLGAARQALLRAQNTAEPGNVNAGFIRDDASLAIVVMSDEEDQSIESEGLLLSYFQSIHGPNRVKVHAIAGPTTEPCATDIRIDPGYRYERMAQLTGGTFHNICLEDWAPVLEALGLNVFTPLDEWRLSQAAVPASITVTVDGLPVGWSATNGFTYDVSTNTIRFHGPAVPRPGTQIDVDYLGNCRP